MREGERREDEKTRLQRVHVRVDSPDGVSVCDNSTWLDDRKPVLRPGITLRARTRRSALSDASNASGFVFEVHNSRLLNIA